MKKFSIFLIIALFNTILDKTYDLENDIETEIFSLESRKDYYFKLHTLDFDFKIVNISLAMNLSDCNALRSVSFNEYSSETANIYNLRTGRMISSSSNINNEYITSLLFSIHFDTVFFSLQITPLYNMDYIRVKATLVRNKFHLTNGVAKTIMNLSPQYSYYFFISSHLFQRAIISLNIISPLYYSSYYNPLNYLDIYEYSDKYSSKYIKNTSLIIIPSSKSLNYQVSDNITQDIAVIIRPNYT